MKKRYKIPLIFFGVLFSIYFFGNITGMAKMYRVPTSGNEPGIPTGSRVLFSNLITPKKGDFICYDYTSAKFGKQISTQRLCAVANDTLLITNGEVFVNSKPFDASRNLQRAYKIPNDIFEGFLTKNSIPKHIHFFRAFKNDYLAFLPDTFAKKHDLKKYRHIQEKDFTDSNVKAQYQKNWNTDHFGPLVIPEGKVFVIGDNRENSQDSRAIGFIDKQDIRGTLVTIVW